MRIGLFTDTYFPQVSGVATSIKTLRDSLMERGHEVYIFTTTDPCAQPESGIIRLKSMPFISFSDRRVAYGGFDRALKVARHYQLDLIHTQSEFSLGLAGQFIASRLKIPVIHTYHTMYENYTHYILNGHLIYPQHVRMLSKAFCDSVHGVVVPSQLTYDTLKGYDIQTPMRIIPTGVDVPELDPDRSYQIRQSLGLDSEALVFLSLCRLSKEKEVDQVIEAFRSIQAHYPQAHLVIAGDGPEREALEEASQVSRVHFVGEVNHDQVAAYYQMADLYLNASQSESQGLTYIEALANRLPIIARTNDYLREIMQDPAMGALVQPDQSFAQAVLDYLVARPGPIDIDCLYPLSSAAFGQKIEAFYQEVIAQYSPDQHRFRSMLASSLKEVFDEITLGKEESTSLD